MLVFPSWLTLMCALDRIEFPSGQFINDSIKTPAHLPTLTSPPRTSLGSSKAGDDPEWLVTSQPALFVHVCTAY